jgi:periplasmic protein TonB
VVRSRFDRRCIAASMLLHLAVLVGVFLFLPHAEPIPEQIVPVVELLKEKGAEGAQAGGEAAAKAAVAAPTPVPAAKPVPPKPRPKPVAKPKIAPVPVKPAEPVAVAEAPVPFPLPLPEPIVVAQASPVPVAATTGIPGAGIGAGVGQGSQGKGPGAYGDGQGPGDDYLNRLRRWLAKYKKYPPEAFKKKQEGSVMVAFTIARDGTVLAAEIERSSGFPLIDQATLDMLQRASPVPPVPAHYTGERLSIAIPVRFSIALLDKLF